MLEVKADALEQSFEAFEDDGVAALKEELEQLKSKIAAGVIAAQRPALDEASLRRAVIFGSVMGSFCVEDFGTRRIERLTFDEILNRYRQIKALTEFEDVETASLGGTAPAT